MIARMRMSGRVGVALSLVQALILLLAALMGGLGFTVLPALALVALEAVMFWRLIHLRR